MVHDQYVSSSGKIPEEAKALSLLAPTAPPTVPALPTLISGGGLLPIPTPAPIQTKLSVPIASLASLPATVDPVLSVLAGAAGGMSSSAPPPLMGNVDPSKVDEIRRTVYVGNLNSQTTTAEQLLEYFKQVGDVKFVRMAGDETQPTRFAFVEFADQESVSRALTFNGVMFGDRPLKINHSNNAIVKPPELTPQAAAKELEDVMKRVREAQSTIAAIIVEPEEVKKRSSSRSRQSRKSRTRSRSRTRRKRSRSRHRSKHSQRSPKVSESHGSRGVHKRSTRSRDRRRSLSRSRSRERRKEREAKVRGKVDASRLLKEERTQRGRKGKTPPKSYSASRRSRSTSRGHRKKSRDCSRSPRRKARSPSPKRVNPDKKRERGKDSSRERKERSASRKRRSREKEKMERKAQHIKVERAVDKQVKEGHVWKRDGSVSPSNRGDVTSPSTKHNGSCNTQTEDEVASLSNSTD
ncbi:hypothetical protein UPYG_G00280300 [Umbra pygmaea]|uniref:Splicing regulatory glutamine/lysine-rich protein 1 n=1 Tax=Umbra pygmaea TaxID=75934 RepID=A0ABD0W304_UMBPY